VDSVINAISALVFLYPKFDMSGKFLAGRELKRTLQWDIDHQSKRRHEAHKAWEETQKIKREADV